MNGPDNEAKRDSAVIRAVSHLQSSRARLHEAVSEIKSRLSSVVRNDQPTEPACEAAEVVPAEQPARACELSEVIESEANEIDGSAIRLEILRNELEV